MITTEQAFAAMRNFLEAYWKRGGRSESEIAILLGGLQGDPGTTADPAQWGDWQDAAHKATSGL
ncbi:hypothetical protein BH10PSE3_BH10PSE3_41690 [soil metagenome]